METYLILKSFSKYMCHNYKYIVFGVGLGQKTPYLYTNSADISCQAVEQLKKSILTKCKIGYVYWYYGKQYLDVVDVYSPIYPINYIKAYKIDIDAEQQIKDIAKF